ncbi:expressed hypothetical protein, partial [Trichoplax adhaerens]
TCAGCGTEIRDKHLLLSMDRHWHVNCLKCSCCGIRLDDVATKCYYKSGLILCQRDYIRRFGSGGSCAGCLQAISPDEMVLKLNQRAYHPNCFTCVVCTSRLTSGDRFRLVNGHIVCEHH